MKKSFSIILFLVFNSISIIAQQPKQNNISSTSNSTGDIKVYFNNPVDTTVATGENAVYLHYTVDDTLIAYINRAKYSIDVAVYNFNQSSTIADIATSINNAYAKGVRIRWIYNGSSSNSGLQNLNPNIPTLSSPTTSEYGIMHNKFMIVDANSTDENDPIVWTGSCNWNAGQMNYDVNNVIIIQDKNLAEAYTDEFNEMWGDTGAIPDLARSKFGSFKTNNTQHIFNIGGRTVECYFSPSDNTNDYILNAINSANSQIYFGLYTFTLTEDANAIKNKIQNQGVYVAGIIDQFSESYSPYSILQPVMGNLLKVYSTSNSIYHDKLVIVDACDYNSDPLVETGSHNWTFSANTINDENSLIIHDSTIANLYYQSFKKNFSSLGGTINSCITTGISEIAERNTINIYPNPSDGNFIIKEEEGRFEIVALTDCTGNIIFQERVLQLYEVNIKLPELQNGIYILSLEGSEKTVHKKIVIQH